MDMFIKKLQEYGISLEEWEVVHYSIVEKKDGISDADWYDILDKYNISISKDGLRKANDTPWGGYMVSKYYEMKNAMQLDDCRVLEEETVDESTELIKKAQDSYRSESAINNDGSMSSNKLLLISTEDLKNPSNLLKLHGFNCSEWELVSARNNIWNVYSCQDGVKELYSSKIVAKPKTTVSFEDTKKLYLELIEKHTPPTVKKYEVKTSGRMLEIPLVDLHIGKFSTSDYVGEGNDYNLDIAKECFNKVIDSIIAELEYRKQDIKKILFPIGNDLLHFDAVGATTTSGTPQDTNMNHENMFKETVLLLISGIEKLSKAFKCEIKVFNVNGNHDFMSSYHALMSLWCYFHSNENVEVDLGMSPRHYERFGNCLIGFSHGDKEGKRIQGIMQTESKDWSECTYKEFHLGHLHSEQVVELNGLKVRNLPSVTATDKWHHNSGYVGALRTCQSFIWDYDNGLVGTVYVNV